MTDAMRANGKVIAEWTLRTMGAVMLTVGSFVLTHLFGEIRELKREQAVIQTNHAALAARVSSEREDTLRSLNRIELTVNKIDSKIDTIKDNVGRQP